MATGAPLLFQPDSAQPAPSPAPVVEHGPTPELRWQRHPVLRAIIRVAAVLAPAVASALAAIAFSRAIPVPSDLVGLAVWWGVFIAVVIATWIVISELLQRTLPLAALLDLTLVFPHSVPSRFAILRRNINRRQLEADLRRLRERSDPESGPRAQLILELAVALSIHDSRTRGHSERVRLYTDLIAKQLRLRPADADRLRWAALLHDIGKLGVAPEILNKPEIPDDEELESLRHHPLEGYQMIAPLHKWLGPWATAVRDHHERYDGTGYPNGLSGRAISLGGRIVAVADSFETMTAGRPYRDALSLKAAREELVRRSGSHFDPYVVRAFLATSVSRLWPVVGIGAGVAQIPFLVPVSWRLSHFGSRAASGVVAAGAAATLVAAGLAGPAAGTLVHGPASGEPAAANVTPPPHPAIPSSPGVRPSVPAVPAANPPSTGTGTAIAPTSPVSSAPAGTQPSPPPQPPPPPAPRPKALYPAGIAKHATLPRGIAKQANPFAEWRLHH